MNHYKKSFSAAAVLLSSLFLISCDQTSDQQADGSPSTQETAVTVSAQSGSYVSMSNTNVSVEDGELFTLQVLANDFSTSEGGAITLHFNPELLQVISVNVDSSVWDFVSKNGQIDNAKGSISDILFSSYKGVSDDAVIATIDFKAVNSGSSNVTIEESEANPFASNGEAMTVTFVTTNVTSN